MGLAPEFKWVYSGVPETRLYNSRKKQSISPVKAGEQVFNDVGQIYVTPAEFRTGLQMPRWKAGVSKGYKRPGPTPNASKHTLHQSLINHSTTMSPIRVGLMGLSATDVTAAQPRNWGVLAHMKPLLDSPNYELVAVCNSSVESARKSIAFHKLPDTVKAYGSPEDLSNDPDVDLVVVSVHVSKHLMLAKPALLQKKDVFVEWPLGATVEEAEELTQLAKEQGVKTVVGVQFRADPLLKKVKELIDSGSIGRVTSSVATACSNADVWLAEASYYLDFKSGGTEFTIYFGHCKLSRPSSILN